MKMQNHDVVQVNWTPGDKKPEPGISVSQLNTAEGSIIRLDDNLPPVTHPAGSKVLCITNNGGDGRAFVSAIFLPGNLDARVFEAAFNKYLAINYGQHAPPNCLISAEVNGVEGVLFSARNEAPGNGIKLIETGWKYNGPGAASGSVPSGNQGVCNPHMGCHGSSHPAAANAVPPIAQGPSENRQANQLQSQ
jgi:hypothetical protein